ncbi:MAG: hypothetical protein E6G27_03200 [Actinobacteria bacterium]|nr:MAG: hypothetical protein E6G27_03200 [Actinomycetota bacterium]
MFFTVPVNDVAAAAATALGALLALLHRLRRGEGQKVTTSLAAMSAVLQAGEIVRSRDRSPVRVGSRDHRGASTLDRYYRAKDGWIRVLPPDAATADEGLRRLGVHALEEGTLETWVAARSRADAVTELLGAGIAAVAARPAGELVQDEGLIATEVLRPDPRPGREGSWTTGTYAHFSRTPVAATRPAPALGEHTVEVLTEAGYTRAEIEELRGDGVVASAQTPG